MSQRISAIIPVYNGQRYLAAALTSVVEQSLPADEIIVVDDASTDGTPAIIEQFSAEHPGCIRYERLPEQRGAAAARNRGVELSTGDLIAFLDADDQWTPDKLRIQINALTQLPTLDAIFSFAEQFISPDLSEAERAQIRLEHPQMPGYLPGAMLIRRASFARVGPFNTDLTIGEFIEWYARARQAGLDDRVTGEILLRRRLHSTNLTRRSKDYGDYLRIVKMSIDQKRKQPRLHPVLQEIFDTATVHTADGEALPLHSHIDQENCYVLQHLARLVPATRVLEVGFAYGISAMAIASAIAATPDVVYHIVDPTESRHWRSVGVENLRRIGFEGRYTFHEERSELTLPKLLADGQHFNFAFIDGNHTFDHVLVDFFYANKMLDVNGIVVFDDVMMPSLYQLMRHISTYPCYERVQIPARLPIGGELRTLTTANRMAAFHKIAADERNWDWHVDF